MIKERRQKRITAVLRREGIVDINDLVRLMPEVSRVTLRRDIAELAEAGVLKRTHGGAVLPDSERLAGSADGPVLVSVDGIHAELDSMDAVILPPIEGRGGDALRRQIVRRDIPFLAESAPQTGGVYLGPDNRAAGFALGEIAGRQSEGETATLLLICQPELPNTRARSDGFEAGFRSIFAGAATILRVNGKGTYKTGLRVAADAFSTHDVITIAFGVNDHSALAAMDAAAHAGSDVRVYACGGEHPGFVGRLAEQGSLRAVAAFFPTVVGAYAVDLIAHALRGNEMASDALTPHVLLTAENFTDFYTDETGDWALRADHLDTIPGVPMRPAKAGPVSGRIGFMPHYPAHDWYRSMMQAMHARCAEHGLELVVSPPHQGIAAELSRLRRLVAQAALVRIKPGQTIILGEGEVTLYLADALRAMAFDDPASIRGVTIITNALDVLSRLENAPALKVILTSGEYQAADRCLVGPSLGALFELMRADIAFLSVSGVSPDFGISTLDERLALAASRFVKAARRTIALADHTAVGADANHRIARPGEFHDLITDDGALPGDRQRLRAAGVDVTVADEPPAPTSETVGHTSGPEIARVKTRTRTA